MRNVLFGTPARWFLVQSPTTSCTDYLERDGFVYRVRVENAMENFDAFPAVNIDFDDLSNGGVPLCTPVTNIVGQYSVTGFNSPCKITQQSGDVSYLPRGENPDNSNFDPANGVSTFDVIQIQRHILNVALFTSPFQKIAADVNNSGTITTLDVILIRKLILGIISEFSEVDSWRFVPALGELDGIFWNDFYDDPFTASWSAPDGSMRSYLSSAAPSYLDEVGISPSSPLAYFDKVWTFYAIKSGDVTGNAQVDLNGVDDEGSTILFTETKTSTEILAHGIDTDEVLVASVSVGEGEAFGLDGYQFSINFDDASLELLVIEPGDIAFSSEDFVVDYGGAEASIRTLWVNLKATPETVTENDAFFSLVFRPKTNLFTMNGLVSFGGANDFKDLVVSSSDKLDIVNL